MKQVSLWAVMLFTLSLSSAHAAVHDPRYMVNVFGSGWGAAVQRPIACDISVRYAAADLRNNCRALWGYLINQSLSQDCLCSIERDRMGFHFYCETQLRGTCEARR